MSPLPFPTWTVAQAASDPFPSKSDQAALQLRACSAAHVIQSKGWCMSWPPLASHLIPSPSVHFLHTSHQASLLLLSPLGLHLLTFTLVSPPAWNNSHSHNHMASFLQIFASLWGPSWPPYLKGCHWSSSPWNSWLPCALSSTKVFITICIHRLFYLLISSFCAPSTLKYMLCESKG